MQHLIVLIVSLLVIIYGAGLASKYAEKLAEGFRMSRYVVGFLVVSFVSILPETFIAISAALKGEPSLGIGTIFGSNVIDLTLIMAIVVLYAGKRGLRVEKGLTKKLMIYPLFLTIPLLLGLDGAYSREEGLSLIVVGIIFYYFVFRQSVGITSRDRDVRHRGRNTSWFLFGMVLLLVGAHYTTESAVDLAKALNVTPILIGVLVVSFGTTLPELFFSLKAVRQKRDALAVGDVLGSVLADATIVVGIVATIAPFSFPQTIAYVAGGFMVVSSVVLVWAMRSQYRVIQREAVLLIAIWLLYVLSELIVNQYTDVSAAAGRVFF